jgi:hypothetical protein
MPPRCGSGTICLRFEDRQQYETCVEDAALFRAHVEAELGAHPELFPVEMAEGFELHSRRLSAKRNLVIRRIRLNETRETYQVRPSFVLPYMVAFTEDVEAPLLLRRWGVPFEVLAYLYGHDHMFWYRATVAIGRCSVVGATIKSPACLPDHLVADEKHTWIRDERAYVATTAAVGCILGAEVSTSASAPALTEAYGAFAREARDVDPEYAPRTVCLDSWQPARKAWQTLFKRVTVVLCFLHAVLKESSKNPGVSRHFAEWLKGEIHSQETPVRVDLMHAKTPWISTFKTKSETASWPRGLPHRAALEAPSPYL